MNTDQPSRNPKKSHRRDAELAEEERRKRNSLRTPRLCGEKDVEEKAILRAFVVKPAPKSTTKTRRITKLFHESKNPFEPAEGARICAYLCSSVCICGFILYSLRCLDMVGLRSAIQ